MRFVCFFYFCFCSCFYFLLYIFILFVCFCSMSLRGDDVLCWLLSWFVFFYLLSLLFFLRTCSRFDLVWFRLFCDHGWIVMLLVSVYLILLFHLIVAPLSSFCVIISLCVAFVVLALLPSYLGCIPLLIGLPFFGSLLRRMFFLPYAYYIFLRTCSRFDLIWFRLFCDHGSIRSRSVNVR